MANAQSTSELPKVLLQVNPGLHKQMETKISILESLRAKHRNSSLVLKNKLKAERRARLERIQANADRLANFDKDTRKVVNVIKEERRRFMQQREAIKSSNRTGPKALTKGATNGMSKDNWGSQPSSILGGSADWSSNDQTPMGTNPVNSTGLTSGISSRRSSLRSISYLELEGYGSSESPGPGPTEDPLAGIKNPGSSGGSRRSSLGSSLMPEVVVTQQRSFSPPSSPKPPQDENRLSAPENKIRIWNLLPAPTPTRFVGRMHAIVSSSDRQRNRKMSESFSRRSSIVTETIKEDEDDQTGGEETESHDHHSGSGLESTPPSPGTGAKDQNDDINRATNADTSPIEETSRGLTSPLPTSARFIGKLRGTPATDRHASGTGGRTGTAAMRRGAWKSSVQQSRDVGDHKVASGPKASLRRMHSQAPGQMIESSPILTPQKIERASPVDKCQHIGLGRIHFQSSPPKDALKAFGSRLMTDTSVKTDIPPERRILPGMMCPFKIEQRSSGAADNKSIRKDAQQSEDLQPCSSHDMKSTSEALQDMKSMLSAAGALSRKSNNVPSTRPGSGDVQSLGDLVKGMQTTSKLMGKLSSLRDPASQADTMDKGSKDLATPPENDDKWDWMTGVPTSLRFLARSWRSIARGPGGIVTETPGQKHFIRNKMPDFSGTVNMLTVLAKADIKLKSQMKEEEESLAEKGKAHNRRRSSGAAVMDKNRLSPKHPRTKSNSNVGLYPERKGSSSSRASTLRTDSDLNSEDAEADAVAQKLLGDLHLVECPSIPKWNVDRTVKEEGSGHPFIVYQGSQDSN